VESRAARFGAHSRVKQSALMFAVKDLEHDDAFSTIVAKYTIYKRVVVVVIAREM
jgi:hypothetical protein